jgi:hypothetical protein
MKYLHKYQKHLNENSNIRNEIDKFLIEHNINGEIKKIKALELMPAQEEIFLDEIVSNFLERKKFIKKAKKNWPVCWRIYSLPSRKSAWNCKKIKNISRKYF